MLEMFYYMMIEITLLEKINKNIFSEIKVLNKKRREVYTSLLTFGNGIQQHPEFFRFLRNILCIMAYAHPTPGLTSIAPGGQFFMHAPHSMQKSLSIISAVLFEILNIP
jgi:hypothetical protein